MYICVAMQSSLLSYEKRFVVCGRAFFATIEILYVKTSKHC